MSSEYEEARWAEGLDGQKMWEQPKLCQVTMIGSGLSMLIH